MNRNDIVSTKDLLIYFNEELIKNGFSIDSDGIFTLSDSIYITIDKKTFHNVYLIQLLHSLPSGDIKCLLKLQLINQKNIYESPNSIYYVDERDLVDDFIKLTLDKDEIKNGFRKIKLKKLQNNLVDIKKCITFVV